MQSVIDVRHTKEALDVSLFTGLASLWRRIALRLFSCWKHDLGRPITRDRKTYRVCLNCGMFREFDPQTWKTYGPSHLPQDR